MNFEVSLTLWKLDVLELRITIEYQHITGDLSVHRFNVMQSVLTIYLLF